MTTTTNVPNNRWLVTNLMNSPIAIGDLPFAPTVDPGKTVDLLRFHSYEQLSQSTDLRQLVRRKMFRFIKHHENIAKTVIAAEAEEGIHRIEEDELNAAIAAIAAIDTDTDNPSNLTIITITASTAPYTVLDDDDVILVDASSSIVTINIPSASGLDGKVYRIKKIDESVNAVTINSHGSETIDSCLTQQLTVGGDSVDLVSDDTEWWVL